ncbi:MAG: SusC/RagA family TonB-linked outer membrane protein [Bacteroidales bacterium]|jgi:TonB-linked SusC/RagA family outer membrane protein|nr:SusC/RagA family TonB-linked outer membrane protein [Bacteroidales bacterium]
MKDNQPTRRIVIALCTLLLCMTGLFAQNDITVRGRVLDTGGRPVIGAAVLMPGTTIGTATDEEGNFMLSVPRGTTLEISSIGYETVTLTATATMNITLREDTQELDETVVVGYGTQKKASLTSAISNIRGEELLATKQHDVVASLQGKVPGLLIRQQSGSPGDFDTDLNLRGYGEPIVVIDGVRRTTQRRSGWWNTVYSNSSSAVLAQLNPDDIESISVLKDASASLYGIGSENGVILVTTKRGSISKPTVRYSTNLGFGYPTARPVEVGIVDYMNLANEMRANSRKPQKYSEELIQRFVNGERGYQDNNYYSMLMKDHSFQQTHNLSIRGGTEKIQYYLSGSFNQDKGILNNPNLGYNRGTFQGNVTAEIIEGLKATYQSSLNYSRRFGLPANTTMNIFYYSLLSDRTLGPTALDDPNHYTRMPSAEDRNVIALLNEEGGYDDTIMDTFTNSMDVRYDAPFLKGLTLNGYFSYEKRTRQSNSLTLAFPLYDYFTNELVGYNKDQNQYSETWNKNSSAYGKFQVNYNTRIGNHNLGAMVAMEATKAWSSNISATRRYGNFYTHDIINQGDAATAANSGSRSDSATAGYLGRINYDYKGKYLVELMARYDGTYVYARGHRWGFFPSYSLGWRVSEEKFFKENLPWFNNLKIRWSDGNTGGQQGSPYEYLLGYNQTANYVFEPGSQLMGYANTSVAQTLISWTDVRMRGFGIDWEIKRGLLGGSVDWFSRKTSGIAATSTDTVPDMYGLSLPRQNLNANQHVGIDLELSHRHHIGKVNYRLTGTLTFSRNRQTHVESEKTAIYTSAQNWYNNHMEGRWSNAVSGMYYEWKGGQFEDWSAINGYPVIYNTGTAQSQMLPGMYKLVDRNGDGVITTMDRFPSWPETNPPLQFGLMVFLNYKNFDMSMMFNGAGLTHKNVSLSGGMGYGFFQTFYESYTDRYRLADGYTDPMDPQSVWIPGTFPAIAEAVGAYDDWSNATYRYAQPYSWVDGTYLRMKSLEIGYSIPKNVLSKVHLQSVRVFFNGTNLLTFCNKFLRPYDPERAQSMYLGVLGTPLLKTYSLGLNITF